MFNNNRDELQRKLAECQDSKIALKIKSALDKRVEYDFVQDLADKNSIMSKNISTLLQDPKRFLEMLTKVKVDSKSIESDFKSCIEDLRLSRDLSTLVPINRLNDYIFLCSELRILVDNLSSPAVMNSDQKEMLVSFINIFQVIGNNFQN
ncbi:hypothetical protein J4405_01680 [Candidatus Woesearchaeota archaeon]|nr:hypothetical protein [Candidatus Woesearchaeota archaeon]